MIDYPQPRDVEAILDLSVATEFFRPDEIAVIRELIEKYFDQIREMGPAGADSGEYIWVVYRDDADGRALGYACYGGVEMSEDVYDLYWIAVDPRYQGKKVGSALLQYVEEDMVRRNARQLYIETADTAQYAPTRAFYVRRGYEEVAHMTDFYRPGDGKVVYRKVFR